MNVKMFASKEVVKSITVSGVFGIYSLVTRVFDNFLS